MYHINWKPLSKLTFADEINFIIEKWNLEIADNFVVLVYDYLETLSKSPRIGIFSQKNNCFSKVISKQTTLFYKIIDNQSQIDLILFWNNTQNPQLLSKLLT